jgi:amidase
MSLDPLSSATAMLAALRARSLTSRDIVEALLDRIDRCHGELNAFLTVDAEGARHGATAADNERADGRLRGALHGLPVTLKDCFATAGLRTTAGQQQTADHVPEQDAVVVARLRAAGAIVLGKTNLPAGVSGQETANLILGRTVNPWDPSRTPGGSSGGAAVAVATGMSPLEVGSDSGGSIRQPCHSCGIYGHVPTHGLVPQRGHLPSVPVDDVGAVQDLFSVGPMARHPADLALALDVLAGPDPVGPPAWRLHLPPAVLPREHVTGVRVAVLSSDPACPTSTEVRGCLTAAADALAGAGAHVVEARPPFDVEHAMDVAFTLWAATNASDDDGKGGGEDRLSVLRSQALRMSHGDWLNLDSERRRLSREWTRLLTEEVDVLLCPVSPVTAVRHDPDPSRVDEVGHRLERGIDVDGTTRPYLDQVRWNVLTGMAGLPATAVPLGVTDGGRPVGAQVVAAPHRDRTTLAFAEAMGHVIGGFRPPPGYA